MEHIGRAASALLPTDGSRSLSIVSASAADTSKCSELQATKLAKALYNQFRSADADGPDVFLAGTVRIFMHYRLDVVMRAVDPMTGIPGKQKWPPAPAEVKAELDAIMDAEAAKAKRVRDFEEQLHRRREFEARRGATTQEERDRAVRYYYEKVRPGLMGVDVQAQAGNAWADIADAPPNARETFRTGLTRSFRCPTWRCR